MMLLLLLSSGVVLVPPTRDGRVSLGRLVAGVARRDREGGFGRAPCSWPKTNGDGESGRA